MRAPPFQITVAADFDGVLHEYRSKWTTAAEILDGPTPGAKKWVELMLEHDIKVIIYSSRAQTEEGAVAIRAWLKRHGFPNLPVSGEKPQAQLYIDDRAFQFNGENWPNAHTVKSFKPWNRKQWDTSRHKRDLQQRISIAIRELEETPVTDVASLDEGVSDLLDLLREYGL